MTRVIAGRLGGRRLTTPKGSGTRPTSDRVREALFSRLQSLTDLTGAAVLDLYAGSGALGIEAASRGAERLLLVETHRSAAALIGRNLAQLGLGGIGTVVADKVERVLRRGPGGPPYDLVLLDPPYPLEEPALAGVLADLVEHGWLSRQAVVVVERSSRSPEPAWPSGLAAIETRRYGETALHLAEPVGAGSSLN